MYHINEGKTNTTICPLVFWQVKVIKLIFKFGIKDIDQFLLIEFNGNISYH